MPKEKKSKKIKKRVKEEKIQDLLPEQDIIEAGFGKIQFMWFFPEFIKHERGKYWYIAAVIIFSLLFLYSYISSNPFFALIVALFILMYFFLGKKDPEYIPCLLTQDGLVIGDKFTEYSKFGTFYIIYNPPGIKNLYFQPKNNLRPRIVVPLENENPVEIRRLLLKYIDEDLEKEEIPASETISHILKI